jgi:hypothetical protein
MTPAALLLALHALLSPASRLAQATPAPASRTNAVLDALYRSGTVPRCWNSYLRTEPNAPSVRIRVRLEVDAAGAVRAVAVLDPAPPGLVGCIRTEAQRLSVGPGEASTAQATYAFTAGAPAPVPAPRGGDAAAH